MQIQIIVPTTINATEETDNTQFVNSVLTSFSNLFGGATCYESHGAWVSDEHGLIIEDSTTVYTNCTIFQYLKNRKAVFQIAQNLCNEMSQEAIALSINNDMKFVGGEA